MLETILQAKAFENMVCIPISKVEEYKRPTFEVTFNQINTFFVPIVSLKNPSH